MEASSTGVSDHHHPLPEKGSKQESRISSVHRQELPLNPADADANARSDDDKPETGRRHFSCVACIFQVLCCCRGSASHKMSRSPFVLDTVSQVTAIFIVKSQQGEIICKVPEAEAVCEICSDSLRENINVLRTTCRCQSSVVHEKCSLQNKPCDYCEVVVHYTPVSLSRTTRRSDL